MSAELQRSFVALWLRATSQGPLDAEAVWKTVEARYGEPARRYHTLKHIRHCLDQADLAAALLPDADTIALGLWFHDVVYEPAASGNEARSAALFRELAGPVISSRRRLGDVERLILVTRFGELPGRDDEAYMADIDYSSLGLRWDQFYTDSLAVRAERPDLSDEQFAVQQSRFLVHLLDRGSLYQTKFFRSRYEDIARSNIARYVGMLRAPEPPQ
jgi:predicted metal-dependent HD superfamily phosphohydrolase